MTEVEIHGGAKFSNREMQQKVGEITKNIYGIDLDLGGVDFSSYYRTDGAKITKTLTTVLRKQLDKQIVQKSFAEYGRLVSELYTVSRTLEAFWGDKKVLGEGVYESGRTCLRTGGENQSSKDFLVAYRWTYALVLRDKKDPAKLARCICYLGGGRNIYLTNFYWNGINQNYLYFVSAIRKMFRLNKVLYRKNPKFFLPIYRNGDAIHIYDERSKLPFIGKKMPCPACGKFVPEFQVYYEEVGSHRLVGCSPECAKINSKLYSVCADCNGLFYTQEMVVSGTDERSRVYRCKACNRKAAIPCDWCGNQVHKDSMVDFEGNTICPNCVRGIPQCAECGKRTLRENLRTVSGAHWCSKCIRKKGIICDICRTQAPEKCKKIKYKGMDIHACKDCLEPAPGTDLGLVAGK